MTRAIAKEVLFTHLDTKRACKLIGMDYATVKDLEVNTEYSQKMYMLYAEAFEVGVKKKLIENKPWNMRTKNYVDTSGADPGDVVVEDDMVMFWTGHLKMGYEILYIR